MAHRPDPPTVKAPELPQAVAEALLAVRHALGNARDATVDVDDVETLLVCLAAVEAIRGDIALFRDDLAARAAPLMPTKILGMDRVAVFERGADAKRATEWDPILDHLVDVALVSPATGRRSRSRFARAAVARYRDLVAQVVPLYRSTGPRINKLKELGYQRVNGGDGTVMLHPSTGEPVVYEEWKPPTVSVRHPAKVTRPDPAGEGDDGAGAGSGR